MYQALYRKYRPQRFSDVVGQGHVTETLRRQVEMGRTSHAYLFVGTRGTGKTTCAKILSRALNCDHPVNGEPCNECPSCLGIESGKVLDVVEIDAASNNGVDNIRDIRDEAIFPPANVRRRVYIIDEVHMLSNSAFNALLKILEEPPEHLVFILATTELNKVPATILSRCQHFSFKRIMPEVIAQRLLRVAEKEGFTLTNGAAALLSRLADGSMRDALSLLDQCVASGTVDEDAVLESVGLIGSGSIARLWEALSHGDLTAALSHFEKLYYGGTDPASLLTDLLSLLRDMLMVRVAPTGSQGLLTGAFSGDDLRAWMGDLPADRLLAASETLQDAIDSMREARDKRTKAEIALLKLSGQLTGSYQAPETFFAAPVQQPTPKKTQIRPVEKRSPEPPAPALWEDVPAPPVSELPPPWEDEEPQEDFVNWEIPPEPNPEPEPAPTPTPAPAINGDGDADVWWGQILDICREQVDGTSFRFLSDRTSLVPRLTGGTLTLHGKNDFVLMMVNTSSVTAAVTQAAAKVLGHPVKVAAVSGLPEIPSAAPASLDDLSRFGDIVKFK